MKALINQEMFTQASLDSGALSVLAAVFHKFSKSGIYQGKALLDDKEVASFLLNIDENSPSMQVDIDLASLKQSDTEHKGNEPPVQFTVNPEGYAMFHVSQGAGSFALAVGNSDAFAKIIEGGSPDKDEYFDSLELNDGDIFSVVLTREGIYSVNNALGTAKGTIDVTYPKIEGNSFESLEPVFIDCIENAFNPSQVSVMATQSLVYRIKALSRIKIDILKHKEVAELEMDKVSGNPVARWRKP